MLLVSVIIPCYKQVKFLKDCIESVIQQSYDNIEILISDDGSNDGSFELIEKYRQIDSRIINLSSFENQGLIENFNKLFDNAKGEFIVFFSGDDIMLSNKIEIQINLLMQNPDVGLVHHDATIINDMGDLRQIEIKSSLPILSALNYTFDIDWFHLKRFRTFLPTTVCARRNYFLSSRFNSNFERKHEILFYFENFERQPEHKWMYIDAKLIKYRDHIKNFTNSASNVDLIGIERVKLLSFIENNYPNFIRKSSVARMFHLYEIYLFGYKYQDRLNVWNKKLKIKKPQFYILMYFAKFLMVTHMYWRVSKAIHNFLVKPIYLKKYKSLIIKLQNE